MVISIPAPARGRTGMVKPPFWPGLYFNSRPREGANTARPFLAGDGPYFNSRPREGANGGKTVQLYLIIYFNSRPREGANAYASLI